ncbi:hypothetical protein B7P43_G16060 [Cryptotermes secundus]|uniref:THUMP domain-containing protein n=1 Tax=Cryptotermes secundus TaxID=105785 RepID=A0A2J7PTM9_9NEOP|nr:hypothetical protein B7P43_G16060 [Cryptotermes secundus]
MKIAPSLHLSCLSIDNDMNILKREVEHADIRKALAFWCEMNKFQGIIYPTENDYKAAKGDEVQIKKLAKILAEARIRNKKCQPDGICDENYGKESHSSPGDNKDERTCYNAAEFEAYHEIDSRKPEDKVLKFRVTCIRNGTHCFGSQDAAYHVGGRLQDMFHWIVDLNFYDLEIMLNIREDSMYYGMTLTKESKHHRNINFFGPTTLRATICYNMLRLGRPKVGDIIIDPLCGGGSIPIEGSLAFKNSYFICGDIHEKAVNRTQCNLDHLECGTQSYVDVLHWDATNLVLRDSSVDIIVTDLALMFTAGLWKLTKKLKINIGGLEAGVYVLWRLKESAAGLSAAPKKEISQAHKRQCSS